MPDLQPGETREEWMARCIPVTMRETENNDQAVAICAAKWEDREEEETRSKFVAFKSATGWRWLAVSSMALEDREGEIVSEKAYDDAIEHANKSGRGELDLIHLKGTDVGDCDLMARAGLMLVEGGTWRDTPMAQKVRQAVAADPDRYGVSIQFRYDPSQFDGRIYSGGIQIRKRSVLPREMAASLGTAITTTGGDMEMTEQVKEALSEMGLDETEIEGIAERQKSVDPEEHVVNKFAQLWGQIAKVFGNGATAPDAGGAESETEVPPAEPTVPEAEKVDDPPPAEPREAPTMVLSEDAQKAIAASVVETLASGMVGALQPVTEKMAVMQATIDGLTARLAEVEKTTNDRLAEVEKTTEDRVMARLRELPPVVKAAPTQVAATITQDDPGIPESEKSYAQQLFAQVSKSIEDAIHGVQTKYQV